MLALLGRHEATVTDIAPEDDRVTIRGRLAARFTRAITTSLPDESRGEPVITIEQSHFQPITGRTPQRPRYGPDPLNTNLWQRTNPR